MGAIPAENVTDFVRQKVEMLAKETTLFELNAPTYKAIKPAVRNMEVSQKGYRLPHWNLMPGGISGYIEGDSSFNAYVAPAARSMYLFPTYMAQPIIMNGTTMRMLGGAGESKVQSLGDLIDLHYKIFTKGIEYMSVGDGSGILAVTSGAGSTLGTGQTLTGTTTAATTAGQTKGTVRLRKGHTFDFIVPATGAVRGQARVETEGATSCTVNLLWGSWSSGDFVTWPNSYNKMPRGLAQLISNASRILQTLNTANDNKLNSAGIDLAGALCTPSTFSQAKTALRMRNNAENADDGLTAFCTYNFYDILKRQGWNLGIQPTETTVGVAKKYKDGDTTFVTATDMDEDRCYLALPSTLVLVEEMPLKTFDLDKQEWRMLLGSNGTGSDAYQQAFGIAFNLGIVRPIEAAFIKRALIASTQTEVSVNT